MTSWNSHILEKKGRKIRKVISCECNIVSQVVGKVVSDCVSHVVQFGSVLQYFLHFWLSFGLQEGWTLFEEDGNSIQWQDFQRLHGDNTIEQIKYLLDVDEADEAVENPIKDESQWLQLESS